MNLMTLDRDGPVFVLTLTDDDNRFNADSVGEWNEALAEVEAAESPAALVTTGTGKFYSNGLDLDRFAAEGNFGEVIPTVIRLFARVLRLPVPTVAALNGHTFAAAAMVSLAHDERVMRTDRGYWCLPEADLGMPLAPGMNDIIRARLAPAVAHEAIVTGRRYTAGEALTAGIVDATASEEDVLATAIDRAAELAPKAGEHLTALRSTLYRELLDVLDAAELP